MIRLLIADDHAILRQGLKQIVEESGEMTVAGEAATGMEALRLARECDCDVVILDISLPGKNGVEVLKQLREEKPHLPVLIVSVYPEDQYAVRLIKAGAAGYLNKECAPEVLLAALRQVAKGKKYITPGVAELLAEELDIAGGKAPHETLSDREYQIFLLLASAKTVSEIADLLALSVKTVSTHRARLLEKMQLHNNAELMRYAIENHLN